MTTETGNTNQKLIDGLRQLANFLEATPDFPYVCSNDFYAFCNEDDDGETFKKGIKLLGTADKRQDGEYWSVRRRFGSFVLEVTRKRELVCHRVLKGTKVIPAEPEKTIVVPAKPEQVIEEYEWQCPDSLLSGEQTDTDKDGKPAEDMALVEDALAEPLPL